MNLTKRENDKSKLTDFHIFYFEKFLNFLSQLFFLLRKEKRTN
jgi:hypothetical protein